MQKFKGASEMWKYGRITIHVPSFSFQLQSPQVNNLVVKSPPLMAFLSLVFKSTVPENNLKMGVRCITVTGPSSELQL
jgi:hypothetical protein